MKLIIRSIFVVLMLLTTGVTEAQTLRSAYFLSSMPMRHKLNPALVSDRGHVGIPVLANLSVGMASNVGVNTFLYPFGDGNLTTFMSSSVSADDFLGKIKNNNAMQADFDMTLLSGAFYAWGGFNTVDVGVRSVTDVNLPGELLRFMKSGQDNVAGNRYVIRDFNARSDNYAQVAFGHAREVDDRWVVGGKVKVLFGAASAQARFERLDVLMSQDKWLINSQGTLNVAAKGATFEEEGSGKITGMDIDNPGLAGMGVGVDLGATFRPIDRLTLSAGVNDLGFMRWNSNLRGVTRRDTFEFSGFSDLSDSGDNPLQDQVDQVKDQLQELVEFYDDGSGKGTRTNMLRATLTAGGEYAILDNKISFGLLSTTRLGTTRIWTEVMGAANFRPCSWYNIAVTGTWSNYGPGWGWVMNFCPRGFNLFVGTDYMITRVTPQYAPVGKAMVNFNFGMSVPIGAKRDASFNRI